MLLSAMLLEVLLTAALGLGRHEGELQPLEDDVGGEVGGVAEVAGIETVVAELVEENLVAVEIPGGAWSH